MSWLNQNSGAVNALLTLILAIATAIYVYLTGRLVRESIAVRKAATQPVIAVSTIPHRLHMNLLDLVIENTGGGPAYDVKFKIQQPVIGEGIVNLSEIGFFRDGFRYFASGQRVQFYLANAIGNLDRLKSAPIKIGVRYRGAAHSNLAEDFVLDFSTFENMSRVNEVPEQDLAETAKKIESSISALARGWQKLKVRVYSLEEEAREGRVHELYMKFNRLPSDAFDQVEALINEKYNEVAERDDA
jgi:hypothetical protein